jgi:hypothetical protein
MHAAAPALAAMACASAVHAQSRPPLELTVPKLRSAPVPREDAERPSWVAFGPATDVRTLPADTPPSGAWDALAIDGSGRIRPRREGVLLMADGQRIVGRLDAGVGVPTWSTS